MQGLSGKKKCISCILSERVCAFLFFLHVPCVCERVCASCAALFAPVSVKGSLFLFYKEACLSLMKRGKDEQRCHRPFASLDFQPGENSCSSGVLFSPGKAAGIK